MRLRPERGGREQPAPADFPPTIKGERVPVRAEESVRRMPESLKKTGFSRTLEKKRKKQKKLDSGGR